MLLGSDPDESGAIRMDVPLKLNQLQTLVGGFLRAYVLGVHRLRCGMSDFRRACHGQDKSREEMDLENCVIVPGTRKADGIRHRFLKDS